MTHHMGLQQLLASNFKWKTIFHVVRTFLYQFVYSFHILGILFSLVVFFPSQFCISKLYAVANIAPYRMMNCLKMISDGSIRLEWAKKFYKWKITMHWLIERVYWSLSCKLTTFNYWNNSHTDSIDFFLLKIMHIFLERIEFTVSSHMWVYVCVCAYGFVWYSDFVRGKLIDDGCIVRTRWTQNSVNIFECSFTGIEFYCSMILYGHLVGVAVLGETCMNR